MLYSATIHLVFNSIEIINEYGDKEEISVVSLSGINELIKSWDNTRDYPEMEGLISIGDTLGGGNFWSIGILEENFNQIFLVRSHLEKVKVFDSFKGFLHNIKYDESGMPPKEIDFHSHIS